MEFNRQHPIKILVRISHFAILLVIPLLRALLFSGGNLQKWISGAWVDILVFLFIIGAGFIVWYFDLYCLSKEGVYKYNGIFKISQTFLPYKTISQIAIESPWYLKIIGGVKVRIDSPDKSHRKSDLEIIIGVKKADEFFDKINGNINVKKTIKGGFFPILGLILLSSNGLTGALYFFTFIYQSGNILGAEFEKKIMNSVTSTANILAIGLPPFAFIISLFILIGWLVSFIINAIRYAHFSVERKGNILYINNGLFIDRHKYLSSFKDINFIEIKQTIFTKILSLYSVFIGIIGYGKGKNEKNIFIPTFKIKDSLKYIQTILPEFKWTKPDMRPPNKFFFRFLAIPFYFFILIIILVLFFYIYFDNFRTLTLFIGCMLWIADAFLFIIKIISFFETGISLKDDYITICYSKRFAFYKVCFNTEKLVKVTIRQTPFQNKANCCSMIFYLYGENSSKHIVPNIEISYANSFLKSLFK